MISKSIQKILNNQIASEAYSSNYYLAMASWCDQAGLPGTAKFLYNHSEEERTHMLRLFHYINDAGGHAIMPAIKQPPEEFKSLKDIFQKLLKHEENVSGSINDLLEACMKAKDHSTANFLQWYVAEQHEEESLLRSILDMINITGEKTAGLFMVDREIEKLIKPIDYSLLTGGTSLKGGAPA